MLSGTTSISGLTGRVSDTISLRMTHLHFSRFARSHSAHMSAAPAINSLTAVLVDDQQPARMLLRELLAEHPAIQIIGEADSAAGAVRLIEESNPDVVFLDIRLGRHNSFNLLSQFPVPSPKIVFVTAFGRYAARAFDNGAFDYVLKPLDPARVRKTVERLLNATVSTHIQDLFPGPHVTPHPPPVRFVAKEGDKHVLVDPRKVTLIEAERNYVCFNVGKRQLRVRKSIHEVEHILESSDFIRVSRSMIIRAADIVSFERNFRGRLRVHLLSGKSITCTAGYRERVLRYLGI
jgi:two-component system, LytTR family, response regulator